MLSAFESVLFVWMVGMEDGMQTSRMRWMRLGLVPLMLAGSLAILFAAIWLWQVPRQDFWPLWTFVGLAVGPVVAGANALRALRHRN